MNGPLTRLLRLFWPLRRQIAPAMAGLLLTSLLNLAGPWLVGRAIDGEIAAGDERGLMLRAGLYVVTLLAAMGLGYISRLTLEKAGQQAMLTLKLRLFDHLLGHDLGFHDENPSGRLLTRIQGDTEALRVLFAEVIFSIPSDLLLMVGMFVVMGLNAPLMAPLVALVLPPYVLLFVLFRKVGPPRFIEVRKVRARLTNFLTEHLRAMPTLRLYDRQGWARSRAAELGHEVYRVDVAANLVPVGYFNSLFLVRTLGMLALLLVGGRRVASGTLTLGALVMGLGYLRQMFNPLMRLSFQLSTIERARAAAIRLTDLLDTPRTIQEPDEPGTWPGLRDALRLEQVHFAYRPDAPVLKGIDLHIPAGQHIGLVGATGAGKSTILNLLLRFRDPTAGAVTIDGVDLRQLSLRDLRRRIGLVLQDVHLFEGTVLDNLGGDRARARKALDTLGIELPLETRLGPGAHNLSRGERQLLTFARALVHEPELLVLDEATSAIDPETEAMVQGALARLLSGRTTVTVAHRLTTVRDCDRIYVLHRGGVAESGSHGELLAQGGLYAALAQLQGVA